MKTGVVHHFARFWFIAILLIAVALGLLFPRAASKLNPRSVTSTVIVIMVFLNLGLALPIETLRHGLIQIKLHFFIQFFIFAVVPFYFVSTLHFIRQAFSPELTAGIYALSCLPTTISSCVVLTQRSGGNAVGATFNASLSNMTGIVLTPFLLSFLLRDSTGDIQTIDFADSFLDLLWQMIIPFLAGLGIQRLLIHFVRRLRAAVNELNSIFIALIVFFSIASAASNPGFKEHTSQLPLPLLYLGISYLLLTTFAYILGRLMRMGKADTIAAVFAAPQKTIALGVPLLTTIFSGDQRLMGIAILPLLFYHPWQVLTGALISQFFFQSEPSSKT